MRSFHPSDGLRAAIAVALACPSLLTACGSDESADIGPLASDVAVMAVKVQQGTTVTIAEAGGVTSATNAPIVESRPARVRVFVEPKAAFVPRDLAVTLTLERPGSDPLVEVATQRVIAASAENFPETTFNFDVDASAMTLDVEWKVAIHEVPGAGSQGDTAEAMLPRDGTTAPMNARSMGGTLDIVLVPARYNFDGSGRVPDTGPALRELFRRDLYPQFPVSTLNITARAPFDYDNELTAEGLSWGRFLEAVLALRERDGAPDTTFYYGVIEPTESEDDFCPRGCVAGVAAVPEPGAIYTRGAVGLGYLRKGFAQVFTHEMGHATGREHTPCGRPGFVDPDYPHGNARIGASGYDLLTDTFFRASNTHDFMSYCSPSWVSDYTFARIFERLRFINETSAFAPWPALDVRAAIATEKGAAWGHRASLRSRSGERVSIQYEDATGLFVAIEDVQITRLSHGAGTIFWIPDIQPVDAAHVRLPNGHILPL